MTIATESGVEKMELIIGIGLIIIGLTIKIGALALIIHSIYLLIKRLIRYNAECQDRYARQRQAEQDLDDLEAEVNYMKDHDWSKEP